MIDYTISYMFASNAYTVLVSGVTATSYTVSSLTANTIYSF